MMDRSRTVRGLRHRRVVIEGGDVRRLARACAWSGIRVGWGMDERSLIGQCGFRAPAFMWLPAGLVATCELMLLAQAGSPAPLARGYRRAAWTSAYGLAPS